MNLPYLKRDHDRHGKPRLYVRRGARKVRLREREGTPEFARAYAAAVHELERPAAPPPDLADQPRPQGPSRGTFGWLAGRYFTSGEFTELDPQSQKTRRGVIDDCLRETFKGKAMRDCPLGELTPLKIKRLRDAKRDKKGAANNRLKYLSAFFGWAIEAEHMKANPCRDVKRLRYATDGFHTWSVEEVAQFEAHHAIGTKARLALALLLYLGVRRGDVVTLGRQHLTAKGAAIRFVPRKTRYKRLESTEKPILPVLADVIAASPTGSLTFLETMYGKPHTAKGFGNWFGDQCKAAGLLHCTAHGLRKAGATRAAENGATVHELMAIFGWTTPAQAEPYTRTADRKRLAAKAMHLLAKR